MVALRSVVALLAPGAAIAQQAGTVVQEASPSIPLQKCTVAGGCEPVSAAVTLDANWRWVHDKAGYENCFTEGDWNPQFCGDGRSCAETCAIEGVDSEGYKNVYGVRSIDSGVELEFVAQSGNVGSRLYVMDGDDSYHMFKLKNKEFTFEVDVSTLACGINGALYFVEMDAKGGHGQGSNTAGAKFGTGYCDAQCPHDVKWQNGEANVDGAHGMCCFEMDIWEANRMATAFTPHPCAVEGPYRCSGQACGDGAKGERYMGVCDKDGCDLNAYRMGSHEHYGEGADFEIDTTKPVTVVTQFLTNANTSNVTSESASGDLVEIRRFYIQDDRVIAHAHSSIPGVEGNSITDEFCSAQKKAFQDPDDHIAKGGLKKMGEALDRGMVLALSIWDDGATNMRWLDSTFPPDESTSRLGVLRGPCDGTTSHPTYLRSAHASATVKYMNIRYGEIGSTTTKETARRLGSIMI